MRPYPSSGPSGQTWAWGYGGIYHPPKDLHTSDQNWLGVWQFFSRSKKLFGETGYLFFLLAVGEIFGSWGVYTPQRKKRAHVCFRPCSYKFFLYLVNQPRNHTFASKIIICCSMSLSTFSTIPIPFRPFLFSSALSAL
jgi:hypothetical protein